MTAPINTTLRVLCCISLLVAYSPALGCGGGDIDMTAYEEYYQARLEEQLNRELDVALENLRKNPQSQIALSALQTVALGLAAIIGLTLAVGLINKKANNKNMDEDVIDKALKGIWG